MHSYWSNLAFDASPGVTLAIVGVLAALPPYRLLLRSRRGRARSAIGFLLGFGAGLAATVFLAVVILTFADRSATLKAGAFAAFFGPFIGLARAKWEGRRKPARRSAMAGHLQR